MVLMLLVVNPDPEVVSSGMIQCRNVYLFHRHDPWIRICNCIFPYLFFNGTETVL